MASAEEYHRIWRETGKSFRQIARERGVNESTVRKLVQRIEARSQADPAMLRAMESRGLDQVPRLAWVKSQEPDEHGNTYSFLMKGEAAALPPEDLAERIKDVVSDIKPVKLVRPKAKKLGKKRPVRKAFLCISDLHAGAYAWAEETDYGDWDIDIAVERLKDWTSRLLHHVEDVDEIILYYNGDTLHTNGKAPVHARERARTG